MIYKVYFADDGVPKESLTPTWESLDALDGTDKSGNAPAITEIGGGWYKFELVYGTSPFDVTELVGVIDGGSALINHERYKPANMSVRDLALTRQVNKAAFNKTTKVETIRNDDDDAVELTSTISEAAGVETRTPS